MGALDSRGVYIYDVDDNVSPLHTLLNLGQGSVSSAIDDAKQEAITAMTPSKDYWTGSVGYMATGWRNAGSTTETRIRRKGDRVFITVVFRRTYSTLPIPSQTGDMMNRTILTVREKWKPQFAQPLSPGFTGRNAGYTINSNGTVRMNSISGSRNIYERDAFSVMGTYYLNW